MEIVQQPRKVFPSNEYLATRSGLTTTAASLRLFLNKVLMDIGPVEGMAWWMNEEQLRHWNEFWLVANFDFVATIAGLPVYLDESLSSIELRQGDTFVRAIYAVV